MSCSQQTKQEQEVDDDDQQQQLEVTTFQECLEQSTMETFGSLLASKFCYDQSFRNDFLPAIIDSLPQASYKNIFNLIKNLKLNFEDRLVSNLDEFFHIFKKRDRIVENMESLNKNLIERIEEKLQSVDREIEESNRNISHLQSKIAESKQAIEKANCEAMKAECDLITDILTS
ncbi:MAG: hypothetical protein MHMPM18_000067 [Marteilia pararefringens]